MGLDLDSWLFTVNEMSSCRHKLDTEEDSQPETSINRPEKCKPINWVQWSKEFENYVAQYKTARKEGVLISYVIRNNLKRTDVVELSFLPENEQ